MKLFNTLTRKVEPLEPLQDQTVGIYSCGPTVYDHAHIGNLRAFIFADTLRRTLGCAGYKINSVMNITDVDDKTIHRSLKDHSDLEPAAALAKLTGHYERLFLEDCQALGIDLSGTKLVRATEHINDMVELIKELHSNGIAYATADGIYFSISKYRQKHSYGVLSQVQLNEDTAQHRIDNDEYEKQDARDFALWKTSDPGEPNWEIEIGGQVIAGRPGWHIECSAMSAKYLGQPFDIHTGGVDLIFPHHENEIAQSRGATGQDLARVFVHNEHLLVDGKKMSKSLSNFYTLKNITSKGFSPMAFRLLILQSHYRSQQNFTWEALEGTTQLLKKIYAWADMSHQDQGMPAVWLGDITSAMLDDLNTPSALAVLAQHLDEVPGQDTLKAVESLFGLQLTGRPDINTNQKNLIEKRELARKAGDFDTSDKLRDELKQHGLEIEDTPNGPRWHRL